MRANGANAHMVTWLVFPPAVSVSASLHGRVLDQPVEQAGRPPRIGENLLFICLLRHCYGGATAPLSGSSFSSFSHPPSSCSEVDRYGPQETGSFWLPVLPASPHTAGPQRCSQPGNQINKPGGTSLTGT